MRLPEDVFIDILTYLPNEEEVVNCLKSKKFIDQKGILSNDHEAKMSSYLEYSGIAE